MVRIVLSQLELARVVAEPAVEFDHALARFERVVLRLDDDIAEHAARLHVAHIEILLHELRARLLARARRDRGDAVHHLRLDLPEDVRLPLGVQRALLVRCLLRMQVEEALELADKAGLLPHEMIVHAVEGECRAGLVVHAASSPPHCAPAAAEVGLLARQPTAHSLWSLCAEAGGRGRSRKQATLEL